MSDDVLAQGKPVGEVTLPGSDQAHAQMHKMIFGASMVQIVRCAALYAFADHLAAGRATPEAVAAAERLDPDATRRLMRACAAFGLMTMQGDGSYAATPLLATLRTDDPQALRYLAITQGGRSQWAPWGRMDEALRTGEPQAQAALGSSVWAYLASPEGAVEGQAVARLMGGVFGAVDEEAAQRLDTRGTAVAADIGGAQGSLLRGLMRANPALEGVLLDLPHVASSAAELAENRALGARLTIQGGSFFEAVPAADLYLLRTILHDWSDAECAAILSQCRRAARTGARLAVIEILLEDGPGAEFTAQLDLNMMVALGGRERSLAEYRALLGAAGFEVRSAGMLCPPFSIIEAVVAGG